MASQMDAGEVFHILNSDGLGCELRLQSQVPDPLVVHEACD